MTTALFGSPVFDAHKALSGELGTALGARAEWVRLDGATFVSASRDNGRLVVIGNGAGWFAIRHPATGTGATSEPHPSAVSAVKEAFGKSRLS